MEHPDLKQYCITAVTLIRANTAIIWWLCIIGFCNTVSTLIGDPSVTGPLDVLAFLLSIFATPVIYGVYFEVIEDTYSSITEIVKTYLPGYTWLLIQMYLPAFFFAAMPMVMNPDSGGEGHFYVILISFSLLYLYVIPIYFFGGKQPGTILSGIGFLFRHLSISTPIILTVMMVETVMLLFQYNKETLLKINTLFFAILDFSVYLTASIIDFALFIVMILLLKHNHQNIEHFD